MTERMLDLAEDGDRVREDIISETMARQIWPTEAPIGTRFVMSWDQPPVTDEVIGVVGDVLHEGLDARVRPMVYLTHPRTVYHALTDVVRTAGDRRP